MTEAVRSLAEMTGSRNLIGVTLEDIKQVTACMGEAMIGVGYYKGNEASDRGVKATELALNAQTLNRKKLSTAKGVLVSIFSGMDLGMGEFEMIGKVLNDIVDRDATVVVGTVIYPDMTNEIRVMIMATGLELCKFSTEITTEMTGRLEKDLHRVLGDNLLDDCETDEMSYLHIPAFLRKK
jgi:cell division protein FtsZ